MALGWPALHWNGQSWPSGKKLGGLEFDLQSNGTWEPVSEPLEGKGLISKIGLTAPTTGISGKSGSTVD